MQIRITRVHDHTQLPTYATAGSVAFDIASAVDIVIPAKNMQYVPTGLIIATPPGYAFLIAARSSLFRKKNLMLANNVGVIDQDFCGPQDEVQLALWNPTDTDITLIKNERLAQGLFVKIERAEWNEGPAEGPSRGGLGSSGGYTSTPRT